MGKSKSRIGKVIAVIPDVQAKPGVSNEHLGWVGNYLAEKRPDVIVQIGDFADMPSLSSYSVGKAEAEGNRYLADIRAAGAAMERLMAPICAVRGYRPRKVLTLGNHESRIDREAEANPRLIGAISTSDLQYEKWGWEVIPFLEVATIEDVEFVHYFISGPKGMPVQSAEKIVQTRHKSGVMGHLQKTSIHFHDKTGHVGIIAGCCYLHEEKYLKPQMEGKAQRRQIIMLHEVIDGIFDPMFVSLAFLKSRYS